MIRQIRAICIKDLKNSFRSKQGLAFIFGIPVMTLLLIGLVFGGMDEGRDPVKVGLINQDSIRTRVNGTRYEFTEFATMFIEQLEANFTVTHYHAVGKPDKVDSGLWALEQDKISGLIVIPANFTECLLLLYTDRAGNPLPTPAWLEIYIDRSDPLDAMITEGTLYGFLVDFNHNYQATLSPILPSQLVDLGIRVANPILIDQRVSPTRTRREEPGIIEFATPGMVGMILLWVGLLQSVVAISDEKDKETFQRIIMAPVSPMAVLGGKALTIIVITVIAFSVTLGAAVLVFGVDLYWNLHLAYLIVLIASLSPIGIGLLISSLAKNSETAVNASVVFNLPMQFFTGGTIPLFIMPEFFQQFARIWPFSHAVSALQDIMLYDAGVGDIFGRLLYVLLVGIGLFISGTIAYHWSLEQL